MMIYILLLISAIFCAAVESVSYFGFVSNHFFVSAYLVYAISITASILVKNVHVIIIRLLRLGVTASSIVYTFMIALETIHYPNYLFSTFHINPRTSQLLVALLAIHYLLIHFHHKKRLITISLALFSSLLIFTAIDGLGRTIGEIYLNSMRIAANPTSSYSAKMTMVYPEFYPAMQYVKELTPEDATILIPPTRNPWELEGNQAMVNYFLYPRLIRNLDPDNIPSTPNTYILISKGAYPAVDPSNYYWPKIKMPVAKTWEIDIHKKEVTIHEGEYDPLLHRWDWGLIEVKND